MLLTIGFIRLLLHISERHITFGVQVKNQVYFLFVTVLAESNPIFSERQYRSQPLKKLNNRIYENECYTNFRH
jgi:hypothetical protein